MASRWPNGSFHQCGVFPVVAQGKAAIITLRADMPPALIRRFCELITELLRTYRCDLDD